MVAEIQCAAPLNAWPIILIFGAVGAVLGFFWGISVERKRWRGPRRVEL